MLHALASGHSERAVGGSTALAIAPNTHSPSSPATSRRRCPMPRSHIMYSRPGPDDQLGRDFDAIGRVTVPVLMSSASPAKPTSTSAALFELPLRFQQLPQELGRRSPTHPQRSLWPRRRISHRVSPLPSLPNRQAPSLAQVLRFRWFAAALPEPGADSSRASANSQRPAGFPSPGPAGQVSVTVANPRWSPAQSKTTPNRSTRPPKAIF